VVDFIGGKKMKKPMFSVYDKVAEQYTPIFLETTDGTALRFIQDQMSKDIPFSRHPQDFRLDRLGVLDEITGEFDQSSKATIIELEQLAGE
jgi:hypothetical protein